MAEAVPGTANAGRRAPYRRAAEEVVAELGSDPRRGLSAEEARARLRQYGPNELQGRLRVLFGCRVAPAGGEPVWTQNVLRSRSTQRSEILEGR